MTAARVAGVLGLVLLAASLADLAGLKTGRLAHDPAFLAVLFASAFVCLGVRLVLVAIAAGRRRRRPGSSLAEALLLAGTLVAVGGGMANWLLRLQGTVILNEGERVRLTGGTGLQVFESGLLSRLEEMSVSMALDEVELVAAGTDGYFPASHLRLFHADEPDIRLEVTPLRWAADGSLRFHQGAFGFAPRIVVLRGDETLFDRVVPFTSRREGASSVSFDGSFDVGEHDLHVDGAVDLASLDEGMRGHASLVLQVRHGETPLGRGSLLPGHFADLEQGYRVGFAGLERWSEIVVARRAYGRVVLAGAGMALLGALLWPAAAWRAW